MSIKSRADLLGLRAVGRVVAKTLGELERAVRPGVTTSWLDEVAARVLRGHGARPAPALAFGFPGSCCISVNEEAVHGVPRWPPSGSRPAAATGDVGHVQAASHGLCSQS